MFVEPALPHFEGNIHREQKETCEFQISTTIFAWQVVKVKHSLKHAHRYWGIICLAPPLHVTKSKWLINQGLSWGPWFCAMNNVLVYICKHKYMHIRRHTHTHVHIQMYRYYIVFLYLCFLLLQAAVAAAHAEAAAWACQACRWCQAWEVPRFKVCCIVDLAATYCNDSHKMSRVLWNVDLQVSESE